MIPRPFAVKPLAVLAITALSGTLLFADSGAANSVARELGTHTLPWVILALRIFGGVLTLVGLIMFIITLAGEGDGMNKVLKVCAFALMLGLGIYLVIGTEHFARTLGLYNAFSAQPTNQPMPDYYYYQ